MHCRQHLKVGQPPSAGHAFLYPEWAAGLSTRPRQEQPRSQVPTSPLPLEEGCLKWPVLHRRGARDRYRWVARAGGGPGQVDVAERRNQHDPGTPGAYRGGVRRADREKIDELNYGAGWRKRRQRRGGDGGRDVERGHLRHRAGRPERSRGGRQRCAVMVAMKAPLLLSTPLSLMPRESRPRSAQE